MNSKGKNPQYEIGCTTTFNLLTRTTRQCGSTLNDLCYSNQNVKHEQEVLILALRSKMNAHFNQPSETKTNRMLSE
jgi:hypothetical protein